MFYAIRILVNQPIRLILTIGGISLCMILILFLMGVYRGVADGSVEYIRENNADFWILQKNSTNILRGTSILRAQSEQTIRLNVNVEEVSPVLLLLTNITSYRGNSTVFLAGYNPNQKLGGPPKIKTGRSIESSNEIVIDQSYAKKYNYKIGDNIIILSDTLIIVGISEGTNAFVIQYAFTTLEQTQSIIGFSGLITCFLVKIKDGSDRIKIKGELQESLNGCVVYEHNEFLENNIKEMEAGFLPILSAIAMFGAVVLTSVLSLILSINILEKKKDFAVLKILGAPKGFLPGIVIHQAGLIIVFSWLTALFLFYPIDIVIEALIPEINTITNLSQIFFILIIGMVIGLISSVLSIRRLKKIYPLEVFYEK